MSTRLAKRLVDPDHLTGPTYVETYGPEVADLCAMADFAPDPQQELALDRIFAIRPNGLPASFEFCVICCRQNLKTGLFKQAAIGWLYVTDERLVVWSAHEMSTTREAHRDLAELIKDTPALRKRLKPTPNEGIYDANGEERIELATGQRLMFKARTVSGGRGLTGDKVILDEGFALKPTHLGSLLPTMMARPEGQVLYGSSAGKADSVSLHDIRERGRAGSSKRLTYVEWLAPKEDCEQEDCEHPKAGAVGCVLDRVELWRKANPTLTTGRITEERIADMRQALPPDEFARECLGWWDELDGADGPAPIAFADWQTLENKAAPAPSRVTMSVAVTPDRSRSSIAVAGAGTADRVLVMVQNMRGTSGVVAEVKRLAAKHDVIEVAVHPSTQAGSLIPELATALGSDRVHSLTTQESGQACTNFQTGVPEKRLEHVGQPELTNSVIAARTRKANRGEVELWDHSGGDASPIIAASAAAYRWARLAADGPAFNVW